MKISASLCISFSSDSTYEDNWLNGLVSSVPPPYRERGPQENLKVSHLTRVCSTHQYNISQSTRTDISKTLYTLAPSLGTYILSRREPSSFPGRLSTSGRLITWIWSTPPPPRPPASYGIEKKTDCIPELSYMCHLMVQPNFEMKGDKTHTMTDDRPTFCVRLGKFSSWRYVYAIIVMIYCQFVMRAMPYS